MSWHVLVLCITSFVLTAVLGREPRRPDSDRSTMQLRAPPPADADDTPRPDRAAQQD